MLCSQPIMQVINGPINHSNIQVYCTDRGKFSRFRGILLPRKSVAHVPLYTLRIPPSRNNCFAQSTGPAYFFVVASAWILNKVQQMQFFEQAKALNAYRLSTTGKFTSFHKSFFCNKQTTFHKLLY